MTPPYDRGMPGITDELVDGDDHTFKVRFGRADACTLVITATAASIWRISEREAAETLAAVIDTVVPRPLPPAFRFAADTVPPSLPLAAVCSEMANGAWTAYVAAMP
jgi:hypothetical protein